jgi:Hemerythrin HHE cation binding domain
MKSLLPSDHLDNARRPILATRGLIGEFMTSEHASLDALLLEAARGSVEAFREFRQQLLRHIKIEERLLLPMAEQKRGGESLPLAARLRLDHGALAALTMLPTTYGTFRAISAVLKAHNPLEEASGGVYDQCEALAGLDASELLSQCEQTPRVPMSRRLGDPKVFEAARRALIRAGYTPSLLDEVEPE